MKLLKDKYYIHRPRDGIVGRKIAVFVRIRLQIIIATIILIKVTTTTATTKIAKNFSILKKHDMHFITI